MLYLPRSNPTSPRGNFNNNDQFSPPEIDNNTNDNTDTNNNNQAFDRFQEYQRRQRTIRFLFTLLMILMLLDGEEESSSNSLRNSNSNLRNPKGNSSLDSSSSNHYNSTTTPMLKISKELYDSRQLLDYRIHESIYRGFNTDTTHPRLQELSHLNQDITNQDVTFHHILSQIHTSSQATDKNNPKTTSLLSDKKDKHGDDAKSTKNEKSTSSNVDEKEMSIYYYPTNATGYYRGKWELITMDNHDSTSTNNHNTLKNGDTETSKTRNEQKSSPTTTQSSLMKSIKNTVVNDNNNNNNHNNDVMEIETIEKEIIHKLGKTRDTVGVFLVPYELNFKPLLISSSSTTNQDEQQDDNDSHDDTSNKKENSLSNTPTTTTTTTTDSNNVVSMTDELRDSIHQNQPSGRIVLHFFSRSIPGMQELSLIDGYVKICDVSNSSFSSPKRHLFLRVKGVLVHAIGKISLVANDFKYKSALVTLINAELDEEDLINSDAPIGGRRLQEMLSRSMNESVAIELESLRDTVSKVYADFWAVEHIGGHGWKTLFVHDDTSTVEYSKASRRLGKVSLENNFQDLDHSIYMAPVPYVPYDINYSLDTLPSYISRSSPPDILLQHGMNCAFELNLNVKEMQNKASDWEKVVERIIHDTENIRDDDTKNEISFTAGKDSTPTSSSTTGENAAWVMNLNGVITSQNCNFAANVNVTAIRTDWEKTTCKAINYCFYMMLTCLAQIVVLLRQLLFTQAQSAAVRVSLFCIGWQTVIDASMCLLHVVFCLMLQPVFTAFAMVAFFKLLIFCVIEMKYMVIIMQARNNVENNNSESLRRRMAILHFRFYISLILCIIGFWNLFQFHRIIAFILAYSFWIPQIVYNIVHDSKKPMHRHYIYGMSLTRMVSPVYMFSVPANFLKEIDPEFPSDHLLSVALFIWVGIQALVLLGQARYGARFMVPRRFLPPKFDYNRPIPDSLLARADSASTQTATDDIPPTSSTSLNREGPRKRNVPSGENSVGAISNTSLLATRGHDDVERNCLDCVICYNEIDVGNRYGYMLAPCDHIFHRECLEQWMEVKMECPVCRMSLPSV